ncbi:MAG: SRPBCC domain-containing protein [Cyanobacteria bacterium P01_D01_bin.56]
MDTNKELRLDRAGRLVTDHAMCWVRYLQSPIEQVWQTVSTKKGLAKWWIVPPKVFDLRVGGLFSHHWDNRINSYKELSYIDLDEPRGSYRDTGGMRFELAARGNDGTTFMFLSTFGPDVLASEAANGMPTKFDQQHAGPGTIWPSVAAGWHGMVDQLERLFSNEVPSYSDEELCDFYLSYLEDQFRLLNMVQRVLEDDSG